VTGGCILGLGYGAGATGVVSTAGLTGSFCQTKRGIVVFRTAKKNTTCPKLGLDGQPCTAGLGCIANCCKSSDSLLNLTGPAGATGATGPIGSSAFDVLPTGKTVRGAIGGDFQVTGGALTDWGIIGSLPLAAPAPIQDTDVIVVIVNDAATGWGSNNDSPADVLPTESPGNLSKRTDTGVNSCADPAAPVARTPCCPGSTIDPRAAAGKVCIYVSGGTNVVNLQGTSVLNGPTGASPHGFKLNWENSGLGETYIDAVWAYTAP
jgi:hypothetical protein